MKLLADLMVIAGLAGMLVGLYLPSQTTPRPAWRNVLVFRPIWKQRLWFS